MAEKGKKGISSLKIRTWTSIPLKWHTVATFRKIWCQVNLYKEVGVNLGCLFIEGHFKTEFSLNFCDTNKLEMRKILNLNGR